MPESVPRCYGRSWERDDPECDDCELEYECRDRVLNRGREQQQQQHGRGEYRRVFSPPVEVDRRISERPMIRKSALPPAPRRTGEKWWQRLLKNLLLGMASRAGEEAMEYCENERVRPWEDDGEC
jgi:hypothetical protein